MIKLRIEKVPKLLPAAAFGRKDGVMASITMNAMYEGLKLWDKDVARYLNSDHVPIYHPVEEFLYELPHWDGKDRIDELARWVPCNNPYWAQLFRRWFLSMVAHWRGMDNKKHANSTSPILVGPQAYRKSTFCRLILPPCLQAYYTDSIDFSRKRDAELYLNRFLLVNMDEFEQSPAIEQLFQVYFRSADENEEGEWNVLSCDGYKINIRHVGRLCVQHFTFQHDIIAMILYFQK